MRLLTSSAASNSTVEVPTKPFEDAPLIGHEHINWASFAAVSRPSSHSQPFASAASIFRRLRGRPYGRAIVFPTASQAFRSISSSTAPASLDASPNSGFNELSRQITDPGSSNPGASVNNTSEHRHHTPPRGFSSHSSLQSRTTYSTIHYTPRRGSAGRLWNPTNSTPRRPSSSRQRRPSTPTIPPVPSQHPIAGSSSIAADPPVASTDHDLLLKPHEQQQQQQQLTNHPESVSSSLQIERSESDIQESPTPGRAPNIKTDFKFPAPRSPDIDIGSSSDWTDSSESAPPRKLDKGKGKAIMASENEAPRTFSADLERGPEFLGPRISNVSGDGIGSAISSSNSSIMGEDVQGDLGEAWGPLHPCYPHLNPHVPTDSVEYATTRIIRIRRDWLLQGDLAPTFSNLYPEILDNAGVSEPEFRRIIDKLNKELVPAFDPYSFRNVIDGLIGLVTGWIWDDLGLTGTKTRLNSLEKWIEKWNLEMEKTVGSEEGVIPPKLISLRRTGYMTLDIQIPDPEIAPAPSSAGAGESRTVLPLEPAPALVA